jgi:hypothetical protein
VRHGTSEPFYERFLLDQINIAKLKEPAPERPAGSPQA